MKNHFGRIIKDLRKKQGFSVRRFAILCGVSHTAIQLLEKGETASPKEDVIKRMADVLEYDKDKLLSYAGKVDSEILERILKAPEIVQSLRKFTLNEVKERLAEHVPLEHKDCALKGIKNLKDEA